MTKRTPHALVLNRIQALAEQPVAPAALIAGVFGGAVPAEGLNAALEALHEEAERVRAMSRDLADVPANWPAQRQGSGLL